MENKKITHKFKNNIPSELLKEWFQTDYPDHNVEVFELVDGVEIICTPKKNTMKNSTFIKNNFKSSTIARLKEFPIYSNLEKIDSCKKLTKVLQEMPSNYSQDDLFGRIRILI